MFCSCPLSFQLIWSHWFILIFFFITNIYYSDNITYINRRMTLRHFDIFFLYTILFTWKRQYKNKKKKRVPVAGTRVARGILYPFLVAAVELENSILKRQPWRLGLVTGSGQTNKLLSVIFFFAFVCM